MIEAINSYVESLGNTNGAGLNYALNRNTFSELPKKISETRPKISFDWLKTEKQLSGISSAKEAISNLQSIGKVKSLCPSERESMRKKIIEKEKGHIMRPTEARTAYNTKQLQACGIREGEIYKYLTYDGHVTNEGKKILKEHGKHYKT